MNDEYKPTDIGLVLRAFWLEWWMFPITMTARMMDFGSTELADEPEVDRDPEDCQLPVPNSHQKDMDHDLFA